MEGDQAHAGLADARVIAASVREPGMFGVIFERHYTGVHGYLSRRAGPAVADDLASATFVVAFERRASFLESADSARPWLLGIATNLLRNQWRSERRGLAALARLAAGTRGGPGSEGSSADPDLRSSMLRALAELDGDHRDVLLLHAWEGLSYREIATALGVPVGTVRSRIARGRARLRSLMGVPGPGDPGGAGALRQEVCE
ncbi:MAG: RNA polymerase sigma factor [Solirubrobacteraceae bacterium]